LIVRLDAMMCALSKWNYRYHSRNPLLKLRPTNVFYVLQKKESFLKL
jgi:hypothetical protein